MLVSVLPSLPPLYKSKSVFSGAADLSNRLTPFPALDATLKY